MWDYFENPPSDYKPSDVSLIDISDRDESFPEFAKVLTSDFMHIYWITLEQRDPLMISPPEPRSSQTDELTEWGNLKAFTDKLCPAPRYYCRVKNILI